MRLGLEKKRMECLHLGRRHPGVSSFRQATSFIQTPSHHTPSHPTPSDEPPLYEIALQQVPSHQATPRPSSIVPAGESFPNIRNYVPFLVSFHTFPWIVHFGLIFTTGNGRRVSKEH